MHNILRHWEARGKSKTDAVHILIMPEFAGTFGVCRQARRPFIANFSGMPSTESWQGVIERYHMLRFISDAFC
jgi:hypothetical protein